MRKSPCIGECHKHDKEKNLCLGCFRTLDEVANWWKFTKSEQREVFRKCQKRKEAAARKASNTP